jgi:hypothetical protein
MLDDSILLLNPGNPEGTFLIEHIFKETLLALKQKLVDHWGLCDESVPRSEFDEFRNEFVMELSWFNFSYRSYFWPRSCQP